MVKRFLGLLDRLRERLPRALGGMPPDADTAGFLAYNRRKWPAPAESRRVIMVGLFDWKPSIGTYSLVGNLLARRQNATLEAFLLHRYENRRLEAVFASFGAGLGLTLREAEPFEAQARTLAGQFFASLKTKADLVHLEVEGLPIGDLIYDSYLRELYRATVDLTDPQLHDYILYGLRVFYACRSYFARKEVVAVIPDHIVYLEGGILTRMAARAGIPVYMVYYDPVLKIDRLETRALDGSFQFPTRWPYWKYPQLFHALPPAEQTDALTRARAALKAKLAGQIDNSVLRGQSAYGTFDPARRVLQDNGKPRILVLLHDFTDAVHVYRELLFPDFLEWLHFLFTEASQTDFDWYVKPHPNTADPSRAALNACNVATVAELARQYPKIHFLEPGTSNHQVLQEGIQAVFTVYGTAGHEFAYLGIPVVNAGDNPHIAYRFNLHARSLEQYRQWIAQADRLEVPIEPGEIEEYYYMNYLYRTERFAADLAPFDPAVARGDLSGFYAHFVREISSEREARVDAYLGEFLARS